MSESQEFLDFLKKTPPTEFKAQEKPFLANYLEQSFTVANPKSDKKYKISTMTMTYEMLEKEMNLPADYQIVAIKPGSHKNTFEIEVVGTKELPMGYTEKLAEVGPMIERNS